MNEIWILLLKMSHELRTGNWVVERSLAAENLLTKINLSTGQRMYWGQFFFGEKDGELVAWTRSRGQSKFRDKDVAWLGRADKEVYSLLTELVKLEEVRRECWGSMCSHPAAWRTRQIIDS